MFAVIILLTLIAMTLAGMLDIYKHYTTTTKLLL